MSLIIIFFIVVFLSLWFENKSFTHNVNIFRHQIYLLLTEYIIRNETKKNPNT